MAIPVDSTRHPTTEGFPSSGPLPDGPFASAYGAFGKARTAFIEAKTKVEEAQLQQAAAVAALPDDQRADMAQLEVIADKCFINELGNDLFERMNEADQALDAMMRIEAPTSFALFLKLEAFANCPWDHGNFIDRLTADAGNISLQFAKMWLERWKSHGGSVTIDPSDPDKAWIGHPTYAFSPAAAEDKARSEKAGLTAEQAAQNRSWYQPFYDGKARELYDVLEDMPGGIAAVKSIVLADPSKGLPPQLTQQEA